MMSKQALGKSIINKFFDKKHFETEIGRPRKVALGIVNIAQQVYGVQLGLVNIADKYEMGLPIGLLSFVKGGYKAVDLTINELGILQTSFKTGVKRFYNIITYTYFPFQKNNFFGYGLGSIFEFNKYVDFHLELLHTSVMKEQNIENPESEGNLNVSNRISSDLAFKVFSKLHLTGGFSLTGQWFDDPKNRILEEVGKQNLSISKHINPKGKLSHELWWGYHLGIRYQL